MEDTLSGKILKVAIATVIVIIMFEKGVLFAFSLLFFSWVILHGVVKAQIWWKSREVYGQRE